MAREENSALLCLLLHLKYWKLGRQDVTLSTLICNKILESDIEGHVFSQNDDQKMTFLVIFSGWCCKEGDSSAKTLTRGWRYQMCKLSRRMLCPISGLTVQEKCWQDLDKLRRVQWGPARWWCRLKRLSFEVTQWEWGSFSLEKGRLPRDLKPASA